MNYRAGSMREKQMNKRKIQTSCTADKTHPRRKFRAGGAPFGACVLLLTICCFAGDSLRAADSVDPKKWTTDNRPALVELYRHLHQTPELSEKEKETSARMAKELRDLGIKVTTNVGGYGVVGVLANGPGKVV